MSCTPLPKATKSVWANQLTQLLFLVVHVKFQFVYVSYLSLLWTKYTKEMKAARVLNVVDAFLVSIHRENGTQRRHQPCPGLDLS